MLNSRYRHTKILNNMKTKFTIVVNTEELDRRYNLTVISSNIETDNIPKNVTRLTDLNRRGCVISYLDDVKNPKNVEISVIDYKSGQRTYTPSNSADAIRYSCYWCRHPINTCTLGCPIDYKSSKAKRTYMSQITKDFYSIREDIGTFTKRPDNPEFTFEDKDYYISYGSFCSFNCIKSFIKENKKKVLFANSQQLINQLYLEFTNSNFSEVVPAPHWCTLREYGGNMTIEQFRDKFNKYEYKEDGIILNMNSVATLYEKNFKF